MAAPMSTFRVIEFYSGIGGMHYSVKASRLDACVVAAVDINDLANKVYKHNFPHGNLMQRNIQSITKTEFSELAADMFLMSPPCQPFTRVGMRGDINDPRTQSFLHLLEMLPNLPKMPSYILIENVKGFETSRTRNQFIQTLQKCGYSYQEFLLSPTHFGIPNQRLRYFLIAKQHPLAFNPARISKEEHRVLLQQQVSTDCDCASGVTQEDTRREDVVDSNYDGCSEVVNFGRLSSSHDGTRTDATIGTRKREEIASTVSNQEDGHGAETCALESRAGVLPNPHQTENRHEVSDNVSSCCESLVCERETDASCSDETSKCETDGYDQPQAKTPDQVIQEVVHHSSSLRDRSKEKPQVSCRALGNYLEDLSLEEMERLVLPDKLLTRFARIMDVVMPDDCNTRCFTKAYGHYVEGTGSMLQLNTAVQGATILKNCSQDIRMISEDYIEQLRNLRIRYFTPREIANLHHFPETFDFPAELTLKQRYRVLGNSLNVHVVSVLLRYMVTESAS